jgi:hypothetical protein
LYRYTKGIAPLKPLAKLPPSIKPSGGANKNNSKSSSGAAAAKTAGDQKVAEGGGGGGGGDASNAEWKGGFRGQVAKTAKTSADATPGYVSKNKAAKEATISDDEALRLLDVALDRRVTAGLIVGSDEAAVAAAEASTSPTAAAATTTAATTTISRSSPSSSATAAAVAAVAAAVMRESNKGTIVRLIHGTGDGFDGLTVELIGTAILLEQHRQWAAYEPLLAALRNRLGKDRFGKSVPVFLKKRWSRDPLERGGVQVSGDAFPSTLYYWDYTASAAGAAVAPAMREAAAAAAAEGGSDTHGDRIVVGRRTLCILLAPPPPRLIG